MSTKKGPRDHRAKKRPRAKRRKSTGGESAPQASAAEEHIHEYHNETSPRLTGGDPDADWERADHVGEEAVGGTVATPDKSVVDDLGAALGVPRSPEEEVRTSEEILEGRDRHRWEQETG